MTLRIVTVDDAVPGNDWKHAVPGKYLYDVTGITAVLNGAANLQAMDASGNDNNGAYVIGSPGPLTNPFGQPGAVTGDAAIAYPVAANTAPRVSIATPTTMDFTGDFSIEWWSPNANPVTGSDWFVMKPTATSALFARVQAGGVMRLDAILDVGGFSAVSAPGAFLTDGAWHHYVWSITPAAIATSALYRDGVSLPLTTVSLPGSIPATQFSFHIDTSESAGPDGMDEVAIYPAALSAGQVAAHYAARGDFAAYDAAVLADVPAIYYHLDEVGGPGGRQAALEITDGTNIVELVPTGYAVNTQVGTTTYSWQPRLQARARSSDGTLLTVPTPELHLPAGYTVGTLTPDLGPDDQWTGILIWWDDAYQTAQQAADSYLYAPGAHLVYQQVKAG